MECVNQPPFFRMDQQNGLALPVYFKRWELANLEFSLQSAVSSYFLILVRVKVRGLSLCWTALEALCG